MTIRLNPRWLLISALVFSLQFCRAQTIPPSMSFDLGSDAPTDCKLWDLTANYDVSFEVIARNGVVMPVQISFALTQDPSGKISTPDGNVSGLVFNNDDNSSFAITTKITGKVTGSGGFARTRFTIHFSGNGVFGGIQDVSVSGTMTVDASTDSADGLLTGRIKNFTADIGGGLNHIAGKSEFDAGLPTDGSWNLSLNVAGQTKFVGTGILAVSSKTLGLDLDGKFKGGLLRLNAKGAGDVPNTQPGQGSNAKIFLTPSLDTLQLDGKLLGQRVSLNVGTGGE
jgi:hypothetical protein